MYTDSLSQVDNVPVRLHASRTDNTLIGWYQLKFVIQYVFKVFAMTFWVQLNYCFIEKPNYS